MTETKGFMGPDGIEYTNISDYYWEPLTALRKEDNESWLSYIARTGEPVSFQGRVYKSVNGQVVDITEQIIANGSTIEEA